MKFCYKSETIFILVCKQSFVILGSPGKTPVFRQLEPVTFTQSDKRCIQSIGGYDIVID